MKNRINGIGVNLRKLDEELKGIALDLVRDNKEILFKNFFELRETAHGTEYVRGVSHDIHHDTVNFLMVDESQDTTEEWTYLGCEEKFRVLEEIISEVKNV